MKKAVFNWSGGKDSAHALWKVMQQGEYDVVSLLTTINEDTCESTMHHIPLELLEKQSECIGIPLHVVKLCSEGTMEDYQTAMKKVVTFFQEKNVTYFIYGDIFLNDVRGYREQYLKPLGIELVEPLWGKSSREVINDFLKTGLQTVIVTTMDQGLGKEAIGKLLNENFINELPEDCDPNGENGEYHTFCYDGPLFKKPVPFKLGKPFKQSYDIRMEDGTQQTFSYWFTELSPLA